MTNENLEPPLDLQAQYVALPLEQRLGMLSFILKQERHGDYQNILRNDQDLLNSDGFQRALKPFKLLIQKAKWDQISVQIFKLFIKDDVNQHYAMKIFLMHEQPSLTSPLGMIKAYQAIKNLNVPEECQDFHKDFLENFTRLTVDQLIENASDNVDESEDYGAALSKIIKSLQKSTPGNQAPKINHDTVQDQYLLEFEADFGHFEAFRMAKEALYKNDAVGSSDFIKELIGDIVDKHPLQQKFIAMYSSIIKAQPIIQKLLSYDQVFSEFAPIQLKNTLSKLFKHLKKHSASSPEKKANIEELKEDIERSRQKDAVPSQVISDLLGEILFEDAKYYEMLYWYLTEQSIYTEIVRAATSQIKTLKKLHQEHLQKASSSIVLEEKYEQTIADFMTVNIDMNLEALQIDLRMKLLDSKKLIWKTTTLVLYDLIKKRCNFENFIALISQNSTTTFEEMLFTQQFFLSYLLNNSDKYLRTMILTTCSFFMPLPLVTYMPKNQKEIPVQLNNIGSMSGGGQMMPIKISDQELSAGFDRKLEFVPFVFEELFYCFEQYMGVLAFKVSANPNKSPKGCTDLTNFVFNRTFQTHSKSLVNYGTIEIQFDYNFEQPMFVPVADAHGLVEDAILERVFPLFKIFMIHSSIGHDNQKEAQKQITKIRLAIENPLIFLIIHDENRKEDDFDSSLNGDIVQISLGRYNNLLGIPRSNLRTLIVKFFLEYIGKYKAYQTDISSRLKSLEEFSDFVTRFRDFRDQSIGKDKQIQDAQRGSDEQMQLKESLSIINNFMKLIDDNKENLRSEQVLTLNVLFEQACRLEKTLFRDNSLSSEECENYRQKVDSLYIAMRNSKPTLLTQELMKIIDHQNYLGLTSIISKFIRSFLELHLNPILMERENLRTEIQKPNLDQNLKDQKLKKIKEITMKLEQRYYSNEFLYREYYISELSKYKGSEKLHPQPFSDYLTLCKLQIQQGQPFEIIDGNNLQFIKEVYQRIQDDRINDEKILVVSVIGPQSSGKSLLLNTLFGAQFLSSEGRCTRGVYGCLIEIKSSYFKKILILDTEGIQSTEAIDEAFDKRIVFYILCVSHVVLLCNKGEMNKTMEDTIKLATDCILQVKEKIDMQPQVNVIMNNVKINVNSLYQAIQSLSNAILEMKCNEKEKQIFTIDQSNVFLLPNAFAQSGKEGFAAYQPSDQFAQKVDQLRQRILNVMKIEDGNLASHTIESWFKFAQQWWEFTDGYSGLTEYSTLEERKEDILLVEFSKKLIINQFENHEMVQNYEKKIKSEVARVLEKYQGFDQTNINDIKIKIDESLRPLQKEVEKRMMDEFSKFTDDKGIRPLIKKRRYEQVETQIKQHFFNWQHIVQQLLGDFNQRKSKFIGDKTLQNAIDKIIKSDFSQFSVKQAGDRFEIEWAKIEDQLRKQLKSDDDIKEDQYRDISNLYMQNARKILKLEQDRSFFQSYNTSQKIFIQQYLRQQQGFFYFNSNAIKPKGETFKQLIERDKTFINNQQVQFFEEQNYQNYYNWHRVVHDRFKFKQLESVLTAQVPQNWLGRRKFIPLIMIEAILQQIQDEGQYFSIGITDKFKRNLLELAETENESREIEFAQKKKKKTVLPEKCTPIEAIKNFVEYLQNNKLEFFRYNKSDPIPIPANKMSYFSPGAKIVSYSSTEQSRFQKHQYIQSLIADPSWQVNGQEPMEKQQMCFTVKTDLRQKDPNFSLYLDYLVKPDQNNIASNSPQVDRAIQKFYDLLDHEELLKSIEKNVLDNIFKIKDQITYTSVENLVQDLIKSDNPNITGSICAMDFKVVQKIANTIEDIVIDIDNDMEPYCLRVSESGRDCLHQITQTQIVRIMQEVMRITEHAPLFTLNQRKVDQRELFIAKLTSNDNKMDEDLAQNMGKHLAQIILKDLKSEQMQIFQNKIKGEEDLFKLKTIVSNIENQIEMIVDGNLPDQFEIDDTQDEEGFSWWQYFLHLIGLGGNQEEEMKIKEESIKQMPKFKRIDRKLEFSPEEIIMYYVNPEKFLKNKFKNQWAKITGIEFQNATNKYAEGKEAIKTKINQYFETFLKKIEAKEIQLATNVFIPEGQEKISEQEFISKKFKVYCQKAMSIYMGLVVSKQWKNGSSIQVDQHTKMIYPKSISLVTHDDIGIELPYAGILQKDFEIQSISNIRNFITNLMRVIQKELDPETEPLQFVELIENLYQEMETNTVGCKQMCPLCRRQCDKVHNNESPENRIHSCNETGHQIQGFGGNKHKLDNHAITFGCHELDENDRVTWQGTELKWEIFKNQIFTERKWSLDDQEGAKQAIKEKNVKIWNKIGPFICQYYEKVEKIEVKFQRADAASKKKGAMQRIHYILMLDKSSSMTSIDSKPHSRWINLQSAISSFIEKFNNTIQNNSKVSIITYNEKAKLEIDQQVPTQEMLKQLDSPNGGTDFNPPLNMAKDLMDVSHNSYDCIILVMMSDGEATYPSQGIQKIKESSAKGKLKFKSIAYGQGSNSDILTKMATELGGTCDKILEPSKLLHAFIEMIPNPKLYGAN